MPRQNACGRYELKDETMYHYPIILQYEVDKVRLSPRTFRNWTVPSPAKRMRRRSPATA